jgi:hypothetical protein
VKESFALLETLIRLEIERLRAAGAAAGRDELAGLYISDAEVDRIITPSLPTEAGLRLGQRTSDTRAALEKSYASLAGPVVRLVQLARLNLFEIGCVLLSLAPEVDLRFERLFGYVQDDVTRRRPSVSLALRLLAPPEEGFARRASFTEFGPLRRLQVLHLIEPAGQPHAPLLSHSLALDGHISAFLLGQTSLNEALSPQAAILPPGEPDALPLPAPLLQQLKTLGAVSLERLDESVIHLGGPDTTTRLLAARALAARWKLRLLSVELPPLAERLGLDLALTLAQREAGLHGAALYLSDLDQLDGQQIIRLRQRVQEEILAPLIFLGSSTKFSWAGLSLPVGELDVPTRIGLWQSSLKQGSANGAGITDRELEALATKFRLTSSEIEAAVRAGRGQARWRNPAEPHITMDDLYAAARAQSSPILSSLAQKVPLRYRWQDIVLPEDTFAQLREMKTYIEQRHVVYDRWGFGEKLTLGKGLMAMFTGPSGTGKTMAAGILAAAVGLDLYRIDLSGVVSKYIGETEKNLNQVFAQAENSNAILFFDEADALFGKRSEVKDAHDRYANIEIAYLLQKMEEYDGAVILATNLKMNLDDAFLRRMHFVVDFPEPDEDDRHLIWQRSLPDSLPLAKDVDLPLLARRYKLSGGSIRNIVLAAAFLAAEEGQGVAMSHLLHATRRELQKQGKMVSPADFTTP